MADYIDNIIPERQTLKINFFILEPLKNSLESIAVSYISAVFPSIIRSTSTNHQLQAELSNR